ncbi:MAG: HAMP domain-containing protein, partial [Oscillospiraceae bacterium]|nr:HAMP domain-containing protein [Oscillospiraceae bacterium]
MKKSISRKVLLINTLAVLALAFVLMMVMIFFMNSLTDAILLDTLQPMARTAAQGIEGNLHMLADRIFLLADNDAFLNPRASDADRWGVMQKVKSGIEFIWLGLYAPSGRLYMGQSNCPPDIAADELYGMMRDTGNLSIENTAITAQGDLEIVMGIPIINQEDEIVYYLVGSYQYDVLSDVLASITVGSRGTAFVINADGKLMAHRDVQKVIAQETLFDNFGTDATIRYVVTQMAEGQTGSSIFSGKTGDIFFSYAPIRGTRWSLGIEVPREDFMAASQQAIFTSVLLTVALLASLIVICILFVRRIVTNPLRSVTDSARKLAMGQFTHRLSPALLARRDEIGLLAGAFDTMSDSIKGVTDDIELLTQAARDGCLRERADIAVLQGDYRRIVAGVNTTLDVICSHLDTIPSALALLNESREVVYCNSGMDHFMSRHGLAWQDARLLA